MSDAKKANIEIHDKEAPIYDEVHTEIFNMFEQRSLIRRFFKVIEKCGEWRLALDLGCGTGNLVGKLLEVFHYVVGLDISREVLKKCKIKYGKRNLECILADCEHLPFCDNIFNFISLYSVLHHIPSPFLCLKEIYRTTKPGGTVYIDHEPNSGRRRKISYLIDLPLFAAIQYKRIEGLLSTVGLDLRKRYYSQTDVHVPRGFDEKYIESICRHIGFSKVRCSFHYNFSARFSQLPYPLDELSRVDDILDQIPIIKRFSPLILIHVEKAALMGKETILKTQRLSVCKYASN
jgi:ubiquinone/menaquinone biosynthesis C-methylase UbiE